MPRLENWFTTIDMLRDEGYAVCVFEPDELRGADPKAVEGLMCERGWLAIDDLSSAARDL